MRSFIVALAALAVATAAGAATPNSHLPARVGGPIARCRANQQPCGDACISRMKVCNVKPPRRAACPTNEKICGARCIPKPEPCLARQ